MKKKNKRLGQEKEKIKRRKKMRRGKRNLSYWTMEEKYLKGLNI